MRERETQNTLVHEERDIEVIIGNLLRGCVIVTVVIVAIGAVMYLPSHAGNTPSYGRFVGEPDYLRSVWSIIRFAFQGDGKAVLQLGLLFLILTPILRVIFSVFAFMHEKDYLYVGLTVVVLGLLLFSLSGG